MYLSELVRVNSRFHRSIHLPSDWSNSSAVESYVVTPEAREFARELAQSLGDEYGSRAWTLVGPYGCGKSAFCVMVADLLCREVPIHPVARELRRSVQIGKPLKPILLTGHRGPLNEALVDGLRSSRLLENDNSSLIHSSDDVWRLYEQGIEAAISQGYGGVLLIIDEFGKFLEYASLHPEHEDLFVLQLLAEGAARYPGQFLMLLVLHSSFANYLPLTATRALRDEWQKIQGRFTEHAFHLPTSHFMHLVSLAIEAEWPPELAQAYEDLVDASLQVGEVRKTVESLGVEELIYRTVPFEPLAAILLWPVFRGKLAQNERSLFAFLASSEHVSFSDFLRTTEWSGGTPPLYRVSNLYDYVTHVLGHSIALGIDSKRWAEIRDALDRLPADAPPLASDVLKTIGLLSLYGSSVGLRASFPILQAAIGADAATLEDVLNYLQSRSLVLWRQYNQTYRIWEGSDLDLEAEFREALPRINQDLPTLLRKSVDLQPIVARSHYVKTGTLRYFEVEVVEGDTSTLREKLSIEPSQGPNGRIIFVLCADNTARERMLSAAKELTKGRTGRGQLDIVALPKPIAGLEETLRHYHAWQWVKVNTPALAGDSVARQEVDARIAYFRNRLGELAGQVLGLRGYRFEPLLSYWVQNGEVREPRTSREFYAWLSQLCDKVFHKSPPLHNELLNRDELSSAAVAARRNLLEAMITRTTLPNLGLGGGSAETTMYHALLAAGGFHRLEGQVAAFVPPEGLWKDIWTAIESFLAGTADQAQPVTALYEELRQPPFGLKTGPLPVVLLAFILANREEVALYEDGVYVPELRIEVLERLTRNPGDYQIRLIRMNEPAKRLIGFLDELPIIRQRAIDSSRRTILSVVEPLVTFVAKLPPYAQRTKRLENQDALHLRETVLRAKDPYSLILEDLPMKLGVSLTNGEDVQAYASKLRAAILALERAYPNLLQEIEDAICLRFGLRNKGMAAAMELKARAEVLAPFAAEKRLRVFVNEARRLGTGDWREALGRALADGLPPSHWSDAHVADFYGRLHVVADDFLRLSELAAKYNAAEEHSLLQISILDGSFKEARAPVAVPLEEQEHVEDLANSLRELLVERLADKKDALAIPVLVRALLLEIKSAREVTGDGNR